MNITIHEGDSIYEVVSPQGQKLHRVGQLIGHGACADIVNLIDEDGLCAKIFYEGLSGSRLGKVKEEIAKRSRGELEESAAAWPLAIVRDSNQREIGFICDKIEGNSLDKISMNPGVSFPTKVWLAIELCKRISCLHGTTADPKDRRIVIGDVSLSNAAFDPRTETVRLLDVDSFQIPTTNNGRNLLYPITELRSHSPESLRIELGKSPLSNYHDNFLLAVCIFELLLGANPLDCQDDPYGEAREQAILDREFPYEKRLINRGLPSIKTVVGDELYKLFLRSFTGDYNSIPDAESYSEALSQLLNNKQGNAPQGSDEYSELLLSSTNIGVPSSPNTIPVPKTKVMPSPKSVTNSSQSDTAESSKQDGSAVWPFILSVCEAALLLSTANFLFNQYLSTGFVGIIDAIKIPAIIAAVICLLLNLYALLHNARRHPIISILLATISISVIAYSGELQDILRILIHIIGSALSNI